MDRRRFLALMPAAVGLGGLSLSTAFAADPLTPIKFALNWKYQGPQGWFFLAEDRGYYAQNGIGITLDQTDGSGAAISKVATGAYQAGFGDMNGLIQLVSKSPEQAPLAVYCMYDVPPFCIAVKTDSPIRTPKDLEGKTVGGPANDGALQLFPAFAKAAGIDPSKVNITYIQPNLREQMLMRGQVDAVFGYVNTIRFSAKAANIDADKEIRYIRYGESGLDFYSNTVIVSRALARDKPALVRGLVEAINHGLNDSLKDPQAAIDAVLKREPLLNAKVERERFDATLRDEMSGGAELAQIGIGDVVDARLQKQIDIVCAANNLARKPTVSEVFSRAFLPPLDQRPRKLFG